MNNLQSMVLFKRLGWIIISVFIFTYLFASALYQPASDDFYLIGLLDKYSFPEAYALIINSSNSRLISDFFMLIFISAGQQSSLFYLLIFICVVALGFFSIDLLFQKLFSSAQLKKKDRYFIVLLCIAFIFYSSPAIGENWFWITAIPVYILPLFYSVLGFYFVLQAQKSTVNIIGAILFFTIANLSSELFLPLNLLGLLSLIYFKIVDKNRKLVWLVIVLFLSAIPVYLGQGTAQRMNSLDGWRMDHLFYNQFKLMGSFFYYSILPSLSFTIIGILSLIYFFNRSILAKEYQFSRKKTIVLILLAFLLLSFFQLPFTLAFGDPMPNRVLFPVLLYLFAVFFPLMLSISKKIISRIDGFIVKLMALFLFLQVIFSVININETLQYYQAFERRESFLIQNKASDKILVIKPLPSSGLLYFSEIRTDTFDFRNQHLKFAYHLKYAPKLSKEKD